MHQYFNLNVFFRDLLLKMVITIDRLVSNLIFEPLKYKYNYSIKT